MARYIDVDKVIEEISRLANRSMVEEIDEPYLDWKTVVSVIFDAPTADVVPREEVEDVVKKFRIARQEVNDWKEIAEGYEDDIDKLVAERDNPKRQVAREIFEEIERETKNHGITYTQRKIAELKKKYTE